MDSRHFATLSCRNYVSEFSSCDVKSGDVILVVSVVWQVLVCILWLFLTSKEFLFSCFEILTNSKSCGCENDLVVSFSEVDSILIPVASKSIDVVNLESNIWFRRIIRVSFRRSFVNEFQESLIALLFLRYLFVHSVEFNQLN